MQWGDVDLDKGEWAYLIIKTDIHHIVPLPRQAVGILQEVYKVTGNGRYVFQNERSRERPMSDMAMNAAASYGGSTPRKSRHPKDLEQWPALFSMKS
jgi:integrase